MPRLWRLRTVSRTSATRRVQWQRQQGPDNVRENSYFLIFHVLQCCAESTDNCYSFYIYNLCEYSPHEFLEIGVISIRLFSAVGRRRPLF